MENLNDDADMTHAETAARREAVRLMEQERLDGERSSSQRNERGQYATPPGLAEEIVRLAISCLPQEESIEYFDPALGSGALHSAIERVAAPGRISRAVGVELDPRFAHLARSLWSDGLEVVEGDFTELEAPSGCDRFNLCVANPPYVRHHHITPDEKARLKRAVQEQLGIKVSGLAGLHVYFLLLSQAWMRENGIGAWLIPTEWMDANYGGAVKQFLTEKVTLLRIHSWGDTDTKFRDAGVSSSLVIFRNAPPPADAVVLLSSGADLDDPHSEISVRLVALAQEPKWRAVVNGYRQLSRRPPAPKILIGDLFRICRGVVTGNNDFFIRERAVFQDLGVPDEFLKPILPSCGCLRGSEIPLGNDGYVDCDQPLALLDCPLTMDVLQDTHPRLAAYLVNSPESQRAVAGGVARKRRVWYKQEKREPAPFLSTYRGREVNGAPPVTILSNRSAAIATNSYLLLYPVGELERRVSEEPSCAELVRSLLQDIVTSGFRQYGRVHGGGRYKLEPKEFAGLPAGLLINRLRPLKT